MKKSIIVLSLIFCALFAYGQESLYEEYKVFNEEGYTYICNPQSNGYVDLYNKNNKWVNTCPKYKDTGEYLEFGVSTLEYDMNMKNVIQSVIYNAFTSEQIRTLRGYMLFAIMSLNSETGKLEEVYFSFKYYQPYAKIPVSVFRKMELELKEKVRFQPTEEGKKLDYIYYAPNFRP